MLQRRYCVFGLALTVLMSLGSVGATPATSGEGLVLNYRLAGKPDSPEKILHWMVVSSAKLGAFELRCFVGREKRAELIRSSFRAKTGHIAMGQIDLKPELEGLFKRKTALPVAYSDPISCVAKSVPWDGVIKHDADLSVSGFDRIGDQSRVTGVRLRVQKRFFQGEALRNYASSLSCAVFSNGSLFEVAEISLVQDGAGDARPVDVTLRQPASSISGIACAEAVLPAGDRQKTQ